MAKAFIKEMDVKKNEEIIDYGCAKGFFVKALRKLGYRAYGVDASRYAVEHADPEIKRYLSFTSKKHYDVGFVKDVLEHAFNENFLKVMLKEIRELASRWLAIIPLGDGKKYIISAYERDPSHFIKQTKKWWIEIFEKSGFQVIQSKYRLKGIKDNWRYESKGNLFLKLR